MYVCRDAVRERIQISTVLVIGHWKVAVSNHVIVVVFDSACDHHLGAMVIPVDGAMSFSSGFSLEFFGPKYSNDNLVDIDKPKSVEGFPSEKPAGDASQRLWRCTVNAQGSTRVRFVVA